MALPRPLPGARVLPVATPSTAGALAPLQHPSPPLLPRATAQAPATTSSSSAAEEGDGLGVIAADPALANFKGHLEYR